MGIKGPPCSICSHSKRAAIEALLRTESVIHVASRFSVGRNAVEKHKRLHPQLEAGSQTRGLKTVQQIVSRNIQGGSPPPAPVLTFPEGASLLDEQRAQAKFLRERIEWETLHGDNKTVAALSGQLTAVQKYIGKLTGALEVTQAQIVRHPEFVKVMNIIFEALGEDLETLGRVREALERVEKGLQPK